MIEVLTQKSDGGSSKFQKVMQDEILPIVIDLLVDSEQIVRASMACAMPTLCQILGDS